ncbi:MAG: Mth938-like domain-containing protein [Gammaproteobacteria bacterium]|nr:Mth938-like domain-containing protein [Gammaproteobacteria bacterium]
MKLSEDYAQGVNVIDGYDEHGITINGQAYHHSLIVSNHQLEANWLLNDISELTSNDLEPLLAGSPEVILMGTGQALVFPHPSIYANIINQGIGIEFMDSAAACRTYNILVSEDRRVCAGIIIPRA